MMGILDLPTEIYWQIAQDLPKLSDKRNVALTSKVLYTHFNDGCYEIAVRKKMPLLARAYQFPSLSQGPVTAAKKYLRAGGGLSYDSDKWRLNLHGLRTVFDHKVKTRNGGIVPGPYTIFADGINSEIGRVIAQIVRPHSLPPDHMKIRMEWLRMILGTARQDILAKVEWQLLLCWLCRQCGTSDTAFEFLEVITGQAVLHTAPGETSTSVPIVYGLARRSLKLTAVMNRFVEFMVTPSGDQSSIWTYNGEEWAQSHPWYLYYASNCPLTHLFLNLQQSHDCRFSLRPMMRFMRCLIDRRATHIESLTFWGLIMWSKSMRSITINGDLDSQTKKGITDILQLLSTSLSSRKDAAWLGKWIIPVACKENDLLALRVLLASGADVNQRSEDGKTPIMYAANEAIFSVLLRHRTTDLTLLDYSGHTNILVSNLKQGLRLDYPRRHWSDQWRSRFSEQEDNILKDVKFILEHSHGNIANDAGALGEDPPLAIAIHGFDGIPWMPAVRLLLEAGADPNVRVAADNRDLPAQSGGNAVPSTVQGTTWLLHHVVNRRHPRKRLVALLLEHGARADHQDDFGRNLCQLKSAKNYEDLCKCEKCAGPPEQEATEEQLAEEEVAAGEHSAEAAGFGH